MDALLEKEMSKKLNFEKVFCREKLLLTCS